MNFKDLNARYLTPNVHDGKWTYTPTAQQPQKGMLLSPYQVFSTHAVRAAICIYNKLDTFGDCVSVHHGVTLKFTHKEDGRYLLDSDASSINLHLDLGKAAELYCVLTGLKHELSIRFVRAGKEPKSLIATQGVREGLRVVNLVASADSREGRSIRISVELSRADQIILSALCLSYARLTLPHISDVALQAIMAPATANLGTVTTDVPAPQANTGSTERLERLRKTIWAIGKQKWPSHDQHTLQRIQKEAGEVLMQSLIDAANRGDFTEWDLWLSRP